MKLPWLHVDSKVTCRMDNDPVYPDHILMHVRGGQDLVSSEKVGEDQVHLGERESRWRKVCQYRWPPSLELYTKTLGELFDIHLRLANTIRSPLGEGKKPMVQLLTSVARPTFGEKVVGSLEDLFVKMDRHVTHAYHEPFGNRVFDGWHIQSALGDCAR